MKATRTCWWLRSLVIWSVSSGGGRKNLGGSSGSVRRGSLVLFLPPFLPLTGSGASPSSCHIQQWANVYNVYGRRHTSPLGPVGRFFFAARGGSLALLLRRTIGTADFLSVLLREWSIIIAEFILILALGYVSLLVQEKKGSTYVCIFLRIAGSRGRSFLGYGPWGIGFLFRDLVGDARNSPSASAAAGGTVAISRASRSGVCHQMREVVTERESRKRKERDCSEDVAGCSERRQRKIRWRKTFLKWDNQRTTEHVIIAPRSSMDPPIGISPLSDSLSAEYSWDWVARGELLPRNSSPT